MSQVQSQFQRYCFMENAVDPTQRIGLGRQEQELSYKSP